MKKVTISQERFDLFNRMAMAVHAEDKQEQERVLEALLRLSGNDAKIEYES